MVHIGKLIKKRVDDLNMPIQTLADKVNISRSKLYDVFDSNSIDTALLENIGKALELDFFQFLHKPKDIFTLTTKPSTILSFEIDVAKLNESQIAKAVSRLRELEHDLLVAGDNRSYEMLNEPEEKFKRK